MASVSSPTKPISTTTLIPSRYLTSSNSYVSSNNVSFSTTLSHCLHLGYVPKYLTRSNVVRNSKQIVSSSEAGKEEIFDVPVLSWSEAIEKLRTSPEKYPRKQLYLAMYSSILGGITTDPAAMVIPMDDHIVHRGHGVFDTAAIIDGYLYELDQHLDRFLSSASMAKIKLPFDRESIRRILIQTVSASKCRNGSLRYWLSAGPGDFQLSPSGCYNSSLYAIVIKDISLPDYKGIKVVTSSIPIKPRQFAIMKSVNYLPNALSKMEAEEKDAYAAIWLDEEGLVAEGPNMNVAFVTKEKELVMPHFDKILSGCTAKRVLVLAESLLKENKISQIKVRNVTVEEGKKSDEMMLIGSGVLVRSVLQWDETIIGDGKEGHVAVALRNLIIEDMKCGPSTPVAQAYVAIDQNTDESRGFGFVNFRNREDVERAINELNGYGYDNLFRVEFAVPRTN